ncbi:MAG: flagellar motor protein MotB [Elusimicrobiota bacterium]|nr:flagellar motor protein MotB [Elusimicrobiota bacterium]
MRKKFSYIQFHGGEQANTPIWLTIYGDMMTNLMLFFMMLWAVTRMSFESQLTAHASIQKTFVQQEIQITRIEEEKAVISEKIVPDKFDETLKIKSDLQGIRIVFSSPILFNLGRAELNPSAVKPLDELSDWLSDVPYTVVVEGHTDDTQIKKGLRYSSNWELSLDRARNVVRYFQKKGIDPKRLVIAGYGEHHPLYPNDTAEHKKSNRRIEIYVVYREK